MTLQSIRKTRDDRLAGPIRIAVGSADLKTSEGHPVAGVGE
jgi:hypothetical protein